MAPILGGRTDVIVSAATASGKTETAFLPMLSLSQLSRRLRLVSRSSTSAPSRHSSTTSSIAFDLGRVADVAAHRWHGDVPGNQKSAILAKPTGLLLITPESLEALFVLRGSQITTLFGALRYIVVDELHSFIGTERGAQLQSLLHRSDLAYAGGFPESPSRPRWVT